MTSPKINTESDQLQTAEIQPSVANGTGLINSFTARYVENENDLALKSDDIIHGWSDGLQCLVWTPSCHVGVLLKILGYRQAYAQRR